MDLSTLIRVALAFEWAAKDILLRAVDRGGGVADTHAIYPLTVNVAFSAELYLKALQVIEVGTHARGHDLCNLHDRLSPETRELLEEAYQAGGGALSFREEMDRGARSFEAFRYPHEEEPSWDDRVAGKILDAFHPVLQALKPGVWATIQEEHQHVLTVRRPSRRGRDPGRSPG